MVNWDANVSGQEKAKFHVRMWLKANLGHVEYAELKTDDVIVVQFCKTLQNWKALVTTALPNDLYFEVTYNGDKHETYLDVYEKIVNIAIPDESRPAPDLEAVLRGADTVSPFSSTLIDTTPYNPAGPDRFA